MHKGRRLHCRCGVGALLAVLVILAASRANAHQSTSWGVCDCPPTTQEFTLTLSGLGTFSKSPDKSTYTLGEFVTVSFTPNPDRVFVKWYCSPSSHIASDSTSTVTGVFITEDTSMYADTRAICCTLHIHWNPQYGTVEGETSGSLERTGNYGDIVSLSASPASGRYTEWSGLANWSGQRYSNAVAFTLLNPSETITANFFPEPDPPNPPNKQITVVKDGGSGKTFTAAINATFSSGGWQYDSVMGYGTFSHRVEPDPGYFLLGYQWVDNGITYYCTNPSIQNSITSPSVTYAAVMVDGAQINIEVEGNGAISSDNFKQYYNPIPVTPVSLPPPSTQEPQPIVMGNPVTLNPVACPGWVFDHWEYEYAGQNIIHPNPFSDTYQCLTTYMNWHTDSFYTPGVSSYARLSPGEGLFSAKAVFREAGYDGVNMPFRWRFTQNGDTHMGVRHFPHVVFRPSDPTYCCADHRDPSGNKYVHAHLPDGYPFCWLYGETIIQVSAQMSDWAWDGEYSGYDRHSGSTFSKNCFAYVSNAPTVMFADAWIYNFTLESSVSEDTLSPRSFGDADHVIRIVETIDIGTEGNPHHVVSRTSEKNASGGVYSCGWLPLGIDVF